MRRTIAVISVMLVIAGAIGFGMRSSIAVWLAPDKTLSVSTSPKAKDANAKFWDALHGGHYERLPQVLEALTAAYIENPRDAETAAHIGFSHVWSLNERARLGTLSAAITDHIVLSRKYFAEAVRLAPDDWRFKGFLAGMEMAEGSVHGDEKLTRLGYFDLKMAIKGWPEFNLFTAGYVMSRLPVGESRYAEAESITSGRLSMPVRRRRLIAIRCNTTNTWRRRRPRATYAPAGTHGSHPIISRVSS